MEIFAQIAGGALFLMLYSWRIITPYLFYRDVISGAITSDVISHILTQGFISGGIGIYFFTTVGFRNWTSGLLIIACLLMAIVSFYFGVKAWWWNKNKKEVEPIK
jgi:hypothetical protein